MRSRLKEDTRISTPDACKEEIRPVIQHSIAEITTSHETIDGCTKVFAHLRGVMGCDAVVVKRVRRARWCSSMCKAP